MAGPAALVPAASQRGRVPGQARRPSGPESCVYPGAGGSSAAEIRPTHRFSSQANVPRPANGSARSTRVGGFGPHPERGNAGLPVASFLRQQREAWRPPLAHPRTCSRSEASDATAKVQARGAIAAQHTLTEGRHPAGWAGTLGERPLHNCWTLESGRVGTPSGPRCSWRVPPSSAHDLSEARGSGFWPDGDAAFGVRAAVRRAPEPAGTLWGLSRRHAAACVGVSATTAF